MIKVGMILGERYEILEKIGTGGMSDVYKAKCHKLNRLVAVKVLKQEFSENTNFVSKFRVEAQAAAGLMHPNIVNVYDVGEENGIYYIVMELVEGITLKNYIDKKSRLSVKEAISIAIQVSMGIEAAHNNHIIHRDIKPQNIIISKEGKVKVTDFGIAKAATSNTITSNVMGSVHYTSPEQARGGFSDEKSDIYSLGCTMFEMLTGHVPFDGETTVAIAIKHIQEDIPSPREYVNEIPISVEKIILKATQKSPDRRYQNMGELIADLKKSLITPDEDFVKVIPLDTGGATKLITEDDIAEIKERTGTIKLIEEPPVRKPIKQVIHLDYDEDDEDEEDDDEYDDSEIDPKMEKVTTILAIVAGVIIGVIALVLVANAIGLFSSAPKKDVENETEETDQVEMVDVEGEELTAAQKTLNDMGLGTSVTMQESEEYEENIVISQDVEAGEMVDKYSKIGLTVSAGSAKIEVPNVFNRSLEEAESVLEEAGFKVIKEYATSDTVPEGEIISQKPLGGTRLEKDGSVTLTISEGKEIKTVQVPDLRNMTESDAKTKLESLNLVCGTVSSDNHDTVPVGSVISQSYSPDTSVDEGTTVNITVSAGPKVIYYKFVSSLSAPTGYTGGTVNITIQASDGDTRSFSTATFPAAVNETGFKVASGTIKYDYTITTQVPETDPSTGAPVIDPDTGQQKMTTKTEPATATQPVNFTQE